MAVKKEKKDSIDLKFSWKWLSIILSVLLVAILFIDDINFITGKNIDEAAKKAVDLINQNQEGVNAQLVDVKKLDDLYQVDISVLGEVYEAYLSNDGKLFFPQAVELETYEAPDAQNTDVQAQNQQVNSVDADDDAFFGDENAPVTIIEFSDYQCPFCERFWSETLPSIKSEYIDTGKVKFVYRDFPLNALHPMAESAALAAECAGEQGDEAYFKYHDKIFENQQSLSVENLKKWAKELGYNIDSCLDSKKYLSEVNGDLSDGQSAGISGTPGFLINGIKLSGAQPFSAFKQIIEQELSK